MRTAAYQENAGRLERRLRAGLPAPRLVMMFSFVFATAFGAPVLLDRVAVVVNKHVIKASDIDHDIRLTDFLNNQPLNETATNRKAAANRLIDQEVIRNEIATGRYGRPSGEDADKLLSQIRGDRFAGSDARLKQALERYGLDEEQLRAQLLWQLTVLRFISERFRPGVLIADEDVRNYYDQHRGQYRGTFEANEQSIRDMLAGQQVNSQFEMWLDGARRRATIEYREKELS